MAKSTNRVHSRHFKEASSATFLRRSYLSISLIWMILSRFLLHQAPAKRSQHANATYRNIVGRNMLLAFGHRVATCWVLLAQIWPVSNLSQQHPTCRNTSQHGGQTHATCCAQQCCDMLCWHVAIVWPRLQTFRTLWPPSVLHIRQLQTHLKRSLLVLTFHLCRTAPYRLWLGRLISSRSSVRATKKAHHWKQRRRLNIFRPARFADVWSLIPPSAQLLATPILPFTWVSAWNELPLTTLTFNSFKTAKP